MSLRMFPYLLSGHEIEFNLFLSSHNPATPNGQGHKRIRNYRPTLPVSKYSETQKIKWNDCRNILKEYNSNTN